MFLTYILCLGKSWEFLAHPGLYTRQSFLVAVGAYGEPCCFSLKIYHSCPIHLNWVGFTLSWVDPSYQKFTKYSNWKWILFTGGQLAKQGMAVNILTNCHDLSQLKLSGHHIHSQDIFLVCHKQCSLL